MPRPLFSHVLNLRQPSGGGGGGGGAPTAASYLVLGLDATLTAERVLTAGVGIAFADTGPNGTLTITNTGVPGPAGPVGPAGSTGPTGATGIAGPAGVLGFPGEEGDEGAVGPPGPMGATGTAGPATGAATVVSGNVGTGLAIHDTEATVVTLSALTTAGGNVALTGWWDASVVMPVAAPNVITVNIYRDAGLIRTIATTVNVAAGVGGTITFPFPAGTIIDAPGAGSHVYVIKAITGDPSVTFSTRASNAGTFWAWELTGIGPPGLPGLPGEDGSGEDGWPGPPGPQGIQGIQGLQGIQGALGSAGIPGLDGLDGEDGPMGPPGAAGAAGVAGAAGPRGLPGMDGLDGDDGLGMPGPPGATGATGPAGPAGSGGSGTGMPGLDGVDGDDGFMGLPGPQGIQGIQGPTGPAGGGSAGMGPPGLDGDDLGDGALLLGLPSGGDPLGQYFLLPGRPGGQTGAGGTAASQNLTLQSTTNATKGALVWDDTQNWWPSFPGFAAGTSATKDFARANPSFSASPSGAAHVMNFFRFDSVVVSNAVGAFDTFNCTGFNFAPTMNMAGNVTLKGVIGAGTYTNSAAAGFGAFLLFQANPTLVSNTIGIGPYPATIFSNNAVSQYSNTGAATMAFSAAFVDGGVVQNMAAGTMTVSEMYSFSSQPGVKQSSGTLIVPTLWGLRVRSVAVAGTTPSITTHVGADVEDLTLNFAGATIATTTPIGFRTAIRSAGTTSGTNARAFQDTGGAMSQYIGMAAYSYTPTSQSIPTGYYAIFSKRQQWTSTQRLRLQGTARVRGN